MIDETEKNRLLKMINENPAYRRAKEFDGKRETDPKFGGWLSSFWPKVGLKNYKTIIGTSFAWCGLFVFAMNTEVGQRTVSGAAAGARSWANYGQPIDWKKDGIPKGAVVYFNFQGRCDSAAGNHVAFADGACSAGDLLKPNAVIAAFGGNQSNGVNRTRFNVHSVCAVRWPSEIQKPDPILQSVSCN